MEILSVWMQNAEMWASQFEPRFPGKKKKAYKKVCKIKPQNSKDGPP